MPLKSSKNDRDIQSIHSAPKMRSTGLEMAKNQGLDSVHQNKKIKIKNFERRQRRDMLAYTGMPLCPKGVRFSAFLSVTNMSLFVAYIAKPPTKPPRGCCGGCCGGCCYTTTGAGLLLWGLLLRGCCCYGNKRREMGRAGCDPRTGNGCERSQITHNFHK